MNNTKSKHFVEVKLSEESSLNDFSSDIERDDDDPLTIAGLSVAFLGIILALLTIILPSIGVLLGRPISQGHEMILNHSIKKDGP